MRFTKEWPWPRSVAAADRNTKASRTCLRSMLLAAGLLCGTASAALAQTPLNITYNLTAGQKVSLNIYNSSGQVVRELLHGAARTAGNKTEQWDGRDDAGAPVTAGSYSWKMLAAPGFGAEYVTSPGASYPINNTSSFSAAGAPGSHVGPVAVAVDSTGFMVGAGTENIEDGTVKVSLDGATRISSGRAPGMDTAEAIAIVNSTTAWTYYSNGNAYGPAVLNVIYNGEKPTDMAANSTNVILSYPTAGVVRWLNYSGTQTRSVAVPGAKSVDVTANGTVYVISGTSLLQIPVGATSATTLISGLTAPRRAAVNNANGEIYIVDMPQYGGGQIKRFSSAGALLQTYGSAGGRTYGGLYQNKKTDFAGVADIAVEADGKFWIAEGEAAPRRVARFNLNGTWIKEWYGGQAWAPWIMPEPDNPRYVWMASHWGDMMRLDVDYATKTWAVHSTYHYIGMADGLIPNHNNDSDWEARVRNGELYICRVKGTPTVFRVDRTNWQLIPLVFSDPAIWHNPGVTPAWITTISGGKTGAYIWTDANGDGRPLNADGTPQATEFQFYTGQAYSGSLGSHPTDTTASNLNYIFSTDKVRRYPVISWNSAGAPVYGSFPDGAIVADLPPRPLTNSSYSITNYAVDSSGNIWGGFNQNASWGNSSETFFTRWSPAGTMAWMAGRKGTLPGNMRALRHIFGTVNNGTNLNCVVASAFSFEWASEGVTPVYVYDQDGLYAGQILGQPINQGNTPNWRYALGGEALAGSVFKDSNSNVYLYGHWLNEGRIFKITGWNGWQKSSGNVTVPGGYTAPASILETVGPNGNGVGLKAEYFTSTNWTGTPVISRVDPQLNFVWNLHNQTADSPITGVANYSVRWVGSLIPRRSGWHMFAQTGSHPGYCDQWINGYLVKDTQGPPRAIWLNAGTPYSIEVKYSTAAGYYPQRHGTILQWSEPETNGAFSVIPQSQYSPISPITQTNSLTAGTQVAYPASATDLINTGQATYLSRADVGYNAYYGSSTANLNDGTLGTVSQVATTAYDADGTWTTTFTLNTGTHTNGFDITQIDSMAGWENVRVNQRYDLAYTSVTDPTPVSLGSFSYLPGDQGPHSSSKISLTRPGSPLATGVKSLIFSFLTANGGTGTAYREIDAFGVPSSGSSFARMAAPSETAPEPVIALPAPKTEGACESECEPDLEPTPTQ